MVITANASPVHLNYYEAIEQDLQQVARFVEFNKDNYGTYSIELAHLLIAASSEVDVVLKMICDLLDSSAPRSNIVEYQEVVMKNYPDVAHEKCHIARYGMSFAPFDNWTRHPPANPDWWRANNKVKHQRDANFSEANLQHTVNAVGALLICVVHYYRLLRFTKTTDLKKVTNEMGIKRRFLSLDDTAYPSFLIV
ncbi:hypothetical protein [Mesorhizobium sp. Z1-4]|uniref:hypothetical protein n=1 Tax=Mesorhizobium sp. Z1-4 TaxID=2448478 RepID=UPI000FD78449|nr:hypothetical protein [Mesorhizobium sp. Z1-4]